MLSEINLLFAILERAICDACGKVKLDKRDALGWILVPIKDDCYEPHSFAWVCQFLDLEPVTLQRKIYYASKDHTTAPKSNGKSSRCLLRGIFDSESESFEIHTRRHGKYHVS